MQNKLKNLILYLFLSLCIPGQIFAFTPSAEQIITLRSGALQNYTAPTDGELKRTKQQVVDAFCKQSLNKPITTIFNDQTDRYLAKQSIFLALLCSQSREELPTFHQTINTKESSNYLKEGTSLKKLKYEEECTDTKDKYKESCNLANLSEQIISDIISDLTTLKQANLYGIANINFTNEKKLKNDISLFAEKYLNIGKADDPQTNFCSGKKHAYPNTCNQAIKNIKDFQKPFQELKIIDPKKLLLDAESKYQDDKLCKKDPKKPDSFDSLFCNTFGIHNKELGLSPFINQIYNELLRYFLFSSYYRYNLNLESNENLQIGQELQLLNSTPSLILNATNQTLKELSDIQATYSFHLGMLSYQEDLIRLRNQYLSKIVTPFYTLFHKLQNVQIPK